MFWLARSQENSSLAGCYWWCILIIRLAATKKENKAKTERNRKTAFVRNECTALERYLNICPWLLSFRWNFQKQLLFGIRDSCWRTCQKSRRRLEMTSCSSESPKTLLQVTQIESAFDQFSQVKFPLNSNKLLHSLRRCFVGNFELNEMHRKVPVIVLVNRFSFSCGLCWSCFTFLRDAKTAFHEWRIVVCNSRMMA